jgi:hypothetical protein
VIPDRVDFHVPGAVEDQVAAPGLRQRDLVQVADRRPYFLERRVLAEPHEGAQR